MNQFPLVQFFDLVAFDQHLNSLDHAINRLRQEIAGYNDQIAQQRSLVEKVKRHKKELQKEVDDHELHLKELDEAERHKKEALDQVANQREFKSVTKEIDALKAQQDELETVLLQTWNSLETVKREFELQQEKSDQVIAELEKSIASHHEKISAHTQEIADKSPERSSKAAPVGEELLEKYEMMRRQVTNPVVPVEQESCSACFYNLVRQDQLDLKKKAMMQCKGCFRFLYDPTVQGA